MRNVVSIALLTFLLLTGCFVIDAQRVVGSGTSATENRDVSDFSNVRLATSGTLTLSQDGKEALTVTADDNILPLIETYVDGDTLVIRLKPNTFVRTETPVSFELSVDDLRELSVSGDGSVVAGDLDGRDMAFRISGNGDISTEAVSSDGAFEVRISGDGSASIPSLATTDASVWISGNGDVEIKSLNASDLATRISGDGDLTVAGEVTTQSVDISGNGNVFAAELISQDVDASISGNGDVHVFAEGALDVSISGNGDVSYGGNPTIEQSVRGNGSLARVDG